MYEHLLISEESGILTITLNRPDKLNAFIGHMRRDLAEELEAAGSDRGVRVVVITGAGRAFCAGGDVNFMAELMERHDNEEFARILGSGRRVITLFGRSHRCLRSGALESRQSGGCPGRFGSRDSTSGRTTACGTSDSSRGRQAGSLCQPGCGLG